MSVRRRISLPHKHTLSTLPDVKRFVIRLTVPVFERELSENESMDALSCADALGPSLAVIAPMTPQTSESPHDGYLARGKPLHNDIHHVDVSLEYKRLSAQACAS
jgi:hypothetical protein